jgi:hypothetical protein
MGRAILFSLDRNECLSIDLDMNKNNWEEKIDRLISLGFSTKLMNDTKWRELFICLAKLDLSFQIAWIDDPSQISNSLYYLPINLIDDRGIKDPGIGGPFLYKQIYYIRISKSPNKCQSLEDRHQHKFDRLLTELDLLGQFPLNLLDEWLELYGYIPI